VAHKRDQDPATRSGENRGSIFHLTGRKARPSTGISLELSSGRPRAWARIETPYVRYMQTEGAGRLPRGGAD